MSRRKSKFCLNLTSIEIPKFTTKIKWVPPKPNLKNGLVFKKENNKK